MTYFKATSCSLLVVLRSGPSLHIHSTSFAGTSRENHIMSPEVHFSQDISNDIKLQTFP